MRCVWSGQEIGIVGYEGKVKSRVANTSAEIFSQTAQTSLSLTNILINQGTHKYILTILCLELGHVISWRTWTPTRNSRHTQVHINYLMYITVYLECIIAVRTLLVVVLLGRLSNIKIKSL